VVYYRPVSPTPDAVSRAYAKVNLALAVAPPIPAARPNAGYHPIASWMHSIDLYDDVAVRRLRGIGDPSRFGVEWAADAPRRSPIDWSAEKDLSFRAHAAVERAAGRTLPVELIVTKRIPVGGGLGGGSSDAAATLVLIDELFGLGLGQARLREIGLGLGSDVGFFVDPPHSPARPAFVSGLGDRVERVPAARGSLLLVVPPLGCETRAVYRAYDGAPAASFRADEVRAMAHAAALNASPLFNDLSGAAERVEPRLGELRRRAERASGHPVRMSGSGSTLFVPDEPGLEANLRRELADVVVVRTGLV
jgi:4-diphosphocytidyl-2-C-methyl-D-erythritol kinase